MHNLGLRLGGVGVALFLWAEYTYLGYFWLGLCIYLGLALTVIILTWLPSED